MPFKYNNDKIPKNVMSSLKHLGEKPKPKVVIERHCRNCGKEGLIGKRQYCDLDCKDEYYKKNNMGKTY